MANGGIIGPVNIPTSTTATGVWQQEEQYEARVTDTWPQRALFTTKSARFNDGSSDYLNRTPSSAGNRKKWTWSGWVKRSTLVTYQIPFIAKSGSAYSAISFVDDQLRFFDYNGGFDSQVRTNRVFRDTSAWYHIVIAYDTAQSTASNRVKIYVNGVQETSFTTANYPSLNFDGYINAAYTHYIGTEAAAGSYFDGYMSEVCFIDGTALTPTSFGVTNSDGVWTPIPYTGTFGNNGFKLQFEDAAALGTDSSPNGNTFTVNNLTSIDQSTDYPVVNFATINSLDNFYAQATFSNGNLTVVTPVSQYAYIRSTIAASSGKWYAELKITTASAADNQHGIVSDAAINSTGGVGERANAYGYRGSGQVVSGGSVVSYSAASYTAGDIISIAMDLDNNLIFFYKNGAIQNSGTGLAITAPASTTDGVYYFATSDNANAGGGTYQFDWNFGSPPFAISSSNADGNGYGNFEYAVPSGYYALNTANLAEFG